MRAPLLLTLLVLSAVARAERGGASAEINAGVSGLAVSAPYTDRREPLLTMNGSLRLGGRYAMTHAVELTAGAYFEPPVTLFHPGALVRAPCGTNACGEPLLGTLKHRTTR